MISILVVNPKGGCGKTTLSTHLAAAFANGGLNTVLADVDRQRSSLSWLKLRPETAAPIRGVDWVSKVTSLPKKTDRVVIDAGAAIRKGHVSELLKTADVVLVPVLPSIFDEASTHAFFKKLDTLKPVRKGKKPVGVVANRLRSRSRAAQRLEAFLATSGYDVVARMADRTAYDELAVQGLTVFDDQRRFHRLIASDWVGLIRFIENTQ